MKLSMNKILELFDEEKVKELFKEKVLPFYPDFCEVKKIIIKPYKKQIWETTYHVVVQFNTFFKTRSGKIKKLPIICSAHSNEKRENVYTALKYLWEHDFKSGVLTLPHPLFYSEYYRGVFYRAVAGNNLYYHIKNNNLPEIEAIIPLAAKWFAKLHNLPVNDALNFNEENSRIETALPGIKNILTRVREDYPEYYSAYVKIYGILRENEKKFLASTKKRWLVHGDAHPENIICVSRKKIAVIDFTDLCLSDYARDLGSFLQQLEYMCGNKINDREFTEKMKILFLNNYFKSFKNGHTAEIEARINNYYNWTAMRTATYFLIRHNPESSRVAPLIETVKRNMGI